MKNQLLAPELRELIETRNDVALRTFCEAAHPAVIADLVSALEPDETWRVLSHAPISIRAEIFSHLDERLQVGLVGFLGRKDIAPIVSYMSPDDRADLFRRMPENMSETILPALAQAEREDIRKLCAYREGTAGAVMTSEYVTLPPVASARQAIDLIRREAPNTETIYYAYIVDSSRKLLGIISLKDLILARPETLVEDIMHPDVIYGHVDDDQEGVARKIQKYDLIALPVINGGDALVGLVTHDDAIDIITQEHTEDMEKFMAISGSHEAVTYIRTPAWRHFKNRVLWVVILSLIGFVSGFIVQRTEYSLWMLGTAIATALGLQVITATLIGAVLPMTAARFKLDPAVVASPALTTIVDVTGLLIFFITVKIMLGI